MGMIDRKIDKEQLEVCISVVFLPISSGSDVFKVNLFMEVLHAYANSYLNVVEETMAFSAQHEVLAQASKLRRGGWVLP